MHGQTPEFEDWITRARSVDIVDAANARGAKLKRTGHEWAGPCPICGGTDRFSINPGKKIFNCRGAKGGDVIEMTMHLEGCEFIAACESLTGEAPPRGEALPSDPEIERERRDERRDREIQRDETEQNTRERKISVAERLWDAGSPILGTHADAYLRRRGIRLSVDQAQDLRFVASLSYEGYRDREDQDGGPLGTWPAMIAAIRDVDAQLIGVHRTYLDADEPAKLVAPGDRSRNKAKKVLGNAKGGAIWLGPKQATIALAEGIETALSWYALGVGPDEVTPVAAVSLGNLSGGSLGTRPHPNRPSQSIQDGVPDPEKPGIRLPELVRDVIILGDGDSDAARTRAFLVTAGRRFKAWGRNVATCMAPTGQDFNDLLLAQDG